MLSLQKLRQTVHYKPRITIYHKTQTHISQNSEYINHMTVGIIAVTFSMFHHSKTLTSYALTAEHNKSSNANQQQQLSQE